MARIELDAVGLTFRVHKDRRRTLKDLFIGQVFSGQRDPVIEVRALQDLTLKMSKGDRLGVVGHNGAGKSTLLRVLAGIYQPTAGRLTVEGRVSALFDISLGWEQDGTGWDNIAYRSYLQGETPRQVREKRGGIAEFSELGEFMSMPVRYYSAGMQMRLAFSIATAIDPEILLVDEVLSVGDLAFQNKARARMLEMMSRAHLMVMVSHDLDSLAKTCNCAVWMEHGRMRQVGACDPVIDAYRASQEVAKGTPTAQAA
jgi:ABC-type polysaccharide/polyol phosphate transport system ATPase subunit